MRLEKITDRNRKMVWIWFAKASKEVEKAIEYLKQQQTSIGLLVLCQQYKTAIKKVEFNSYLR